jgi:hypothetical protein
MTSLTISTRGRSWARSGGGRRLTAARSGRVESTTVTFVVGERGDQLVEFVGEAGAVEPGVRVRRSADEHRDQVG